MFTPILITAEIKHKFNIERATPQDWAIPTIISKVAIIANDKITFSSSYYCWNFLPKQIIMKQLILIDDVPPAEPSNPLLNALEDLL